MSNPEPPSSKTASDAAPEGVSSRSGPLHVVACEGASKLEITVTSPTQGRELIECLHDLARLGDVYIRYHENLPWSKFVSQSVVEVPSFKKGRG